MDLSVQIEIGGGLSWERWKRIVPLVDRLGYRGLYICDHYYAGDGYPDSIEINLAFTYLAMQSQRLEFGSLVAPVSFRDPRFLVRQAMHLDNLSGGRMIVGVGAGWNEREHRSFGYELGDKKTRMDRFAEALEVMTLLARHDEPVSFDGKFYRLEDAKIMPRAARPNGPRIMVGGAGPQRTLPLTARYADVWNTGGNRGPEGYKEPSARLDELLVKRGRKPSDVRRTLMAQVIPFRNDAELAQRMRFRQEAEPGLSPKELLASMRERSPHGIVGSPAECVEKIKAYQAVGVQEIMVQRMDLDDDEGIQLIAEEVMPHVGGAST
jgi:alkanesulfonate monooxygenase SsuD/methylene tetrahydromethanopterin reductase-like flavin-dependent oxidoreductase (luciferase family)